MSAFGLIFYSIELGNVICEGQRVWLANALIWKDLIFYFSHLHCFTYFITLIFMISLFFLCCSRSLNHRRIYIQVQGTCLGFLQIFIAFISKFPIDWYCSCTNMNCQISYVHSGQFITPFLVFFISKCSVYHEQFILQIWWF